MRSHLAAWLASVMLLAGTPAHAAGHDPRMLRAAEERVFRLLICGKPVIRHGDDNCASVASYPNGKVQGPLRLDLTSISFGSFTAAGRDQALVTYIGLEPHANNWGGSILFERQRSHWRVMQWLPGTLTDECVVLPGVRQALLCLEGWAGQGEVDSSVWLIRVPARGDIEKVAVLKAQDDISAAPGDNHPDYQCTLPRKKTEGILLLIDDLKRSEKHGGFAQSKITYVMPGEVNRACRKQNLSTARKLHSVVTFRIEGNNVVADTPVKFAKTDY